MLQERREPYEAVDASPRSEVTVKYSALGKIPALIDGEDGLTDSLAVMTCLADKHGKLTAPAGTVARARQDAMTFWLIDEFDAILWAAAKHSFALPEDVRVPAVKDALKYEFEKSATTLSNRLQSDFLMGDEITLPDILACHCLNWAIGAKCPRTDDKLFRYAKGLRERPAYQAISAA